MSVNTSLFIMSFFTYQNPESMVKLAKIQAYTKIQSFLSPCL